MTSSIPDFATHYHLADKPPFVNLSDLDEIALGAVLYDLGKRKSTGLKRVFGRRYMEMRRLTEARLYELFLRAGGRPERRVPHYFCLGPCEWFRALSPDMREVVVPLAELPDEVASFTYPDSFTAMGFAPRFGLPYEPRPYHGRVFRMAELRDVIAEYGLPEGDADDDYHGYHRRPFEKYIEIQVWSNEPVKRFQH